MYRYFSAALLILSGSLYLNLMVVGGSKLMSVDIKGRNINHEMVIDGHAWVYRKYMTDRSWLRDEKAARKAKIGLWSHANPVKPWK